MGETPKERAKNENFQPASHTKWWKKRLVITRRGPYRLLQRLWTRRKRGTRLFRAFRRHEQLRTFCTEIFPPLVRLASASPAKGKRQRDEHTSVREKETRSRVGERARGTRV